MLLAPLEDKESSAVVAPSRLRHLDMLVTAVACLSLLMGAPGRAVAEASVDNTQTASHPDRAPAESSDEWVGVEMAPGWVNVMAEARTDSQVFRRVSWGGMGSLRFGRRSWGRFYWVPFQGGLGINRYGNSVVFHLTTELGWHQPLSLNAFVDLGGAMGLGALMVPYRMDCDTTCWAGGVPWLVSPVIRLGMAGRYGTASVFVRAVVPLTNTVDSIHAFATIVLFGMDLGLSR